MRKQTPTLFIILLIILLPGCAPNLPIASQPTYDATLVAIAAEATVTALSRANPPATSAPEVPAPTMSPTAAVSQPTATFPPNPEFWVVYLTKNKLATINGSGAKIAQLTNTPGLDYLPTWSPDGTLLAFLRFDGSNHQDGLLHLLPAGSNTPRIVDEANTYNHFFWTPDSRHLLATRGFSGAYDVYLLDSAGGLAVEVAKNVAEYPRLSPDGKQIVMLVNTGVSCNGKGCMSPNDLFLYDLPSRQTTRLTGDALPKMSVNWSPDGSQIAYHLADEVNNLVELIQPDGKLVASKANPPWWRDFWLRSPDGSQIAYYINDTANGGVEIYIMPGSGSGEPRLVTRVESSGNTMAYIDTLRWRPDGSGFVFNTWTGLYTVNLDGSELRSLPVVLENVFFDVRPVTDTFIPAPNPTAPASWKLCQGGKESRLDVGRQATVSTDPPTPNNVRQGPARTTELVGQIQPGERIEIIGGPICNNGITWWEIRSLASGLKGYTMEGDQEAYWLVPAQ